MNRDLTKLETLGGGAKNTMESERAEGARKFVGRYSRKFSGFSIE